MLAQSMFGNAYGQSMLGTTAPNQPRKASRWGPVEDPFSGLNAVNQNALMPIVVEPPAAPPVATAPPGPR